MFHSSSGTTFTERIGGRIDFERPGCPNRLKGRHFSEDSVYDQSTLFLMGFEHESAELSETQPASPRPCLCCQARVQTPVVSELVSSLRTCQGQRELTPRVKSW